ncbi:MAG: DNA-binding protein [Sphingobium sp.]|nr:DNA-binding protein [Sphingobium sp.]
MRPYTKPAKSIPDQIALMQARGMIVGDIPIAERCLAHISYYRLRAYWLYYEANPADPSHALRPGTRFEDVLALYEFDRQLRLLLLDAIERIEVAARGSWAYRMAMQYGSHGYLKPSLYKDRREFDRNFKSLVGDVDRSHDTFIKHYKAEYDDPVMPPVWMAAELISMGLLSKWQSGLALAADRKAIARPFGLDERVYLSFIHHLVTVRNVCAHHGRLWNKAFTVTPIIPARPINLAQSVSAAAPRQLYNCLTICAFLLRQIGEGTDWRDRMRALIPANPTGDLAAMGCPPDWQARPVWA